MGITFFVIFLSHIIRHLQSRFESITVLKNTIKVWHPKSNSKMDFLSTYFIRVPDYSYNYFEVKPSRKNCMYIRYLKTPAIVVKDLLGFSHFCYLSKPGRERLKMVHQSTLKKSLACILWNGHFALYKKM